jgi:hypothetical protein
MGVEQFTDNCTVCRRRIVPIETNICNRCAEMMAKAKEIAARLPEASAHLAMLPQGPLRTEEHMGRWVLRGIDGEVQPGVNLALGVEREAVARYLGLIEAENHSRLHEPGGMDASGPAT